jgi:Tfp pilus assembly protein PilE
MNMKKRRKGFTLIDLLIAVATIAILTLISVPSLFTVQVHAKVARANGDMRTLATALEAYHADHNRYPQPHAWLHEPTPGVLDSFHVQAYIALSTPVAYITNSILPAPFSNHCGGTRERVDTTYEIGFSNPGVRSKALVDRLKSSGIMTNRSTYLIQSFGPDLRDDTHINGFGQTATSGDPVSYSATGIGRFGRRPQVRGSAVPFNTVFMSAPCRGNS